MEKRKKRILAIVLSIVIVNTAAGVGAWFLFRAWFLGRIPPEENEFETPGAPPGINLNQIIKVGVAGDISDITGDGTYEGAYYAAKEVNLLTAQGKAGGIYINGTPYYVGLVKEDTDEANPNLDVSKGVAAAESLVDKGIQFALGGFRSEALVAYSEVFMDKKVIFLSTGTATDDFCSNVKDFYAIYKYFFRYMPINSSSLGAQISGTLADFILTMNATYPNHEVRRIGILAEDLTWTTDLVATILAYMPLLTGGWAQMLTPIFYDIALTNADMNSLLASLAAYGADIIIPLISAQGGLMMMQQYAAYQYPYLIFGIDVQSQLDTFWDDTQGGCVFEAIMQTLYACNKTAAAWDFWWDFIDQFGHEPLYTAIGAYDAVNALRDAIVATQSLRADPIIAYMETWDRSNPHPGVGGDYAWWPNTHDLVAGYPYGYTLWTQWQIDGTKNVVPAATYPDVGAHGNIVTGPYVVAPWVNTAWL